MKTRGLFLYVAILLCVSIMICKNLSKKGKKNEISIKRLECDSDKPFLKNCLVNKICCPNSTDICIKKVTSCTSWNIFRTKCEVGTFEDACG
jgi:hypothetical protein